MWGDYKKLTVKNLVDSLQNYPDDMEVIIDGWQYNCNGYEIFGRKHINFGMKDKKLICEAKGQDVNQFVIISPRKLYVSVHD